MASQHWLTASTLLDPLWQALHWWKPLSKLAAALQAGSLTLSSQVCSRPHMLACLCRLTASVSLHLQRAVSRIRCLMHRPASACAWDVTYDRYAGHVSKAQGLSSMHLICRGNPARSSAPAWLCGKPEPLPTAAHRCPNYVCPLTSIRAFCGHLHASQCRQVLVCVTMDHQ